MNIKTFTDRSAASIAASDRIASAARDVLAAQDETTIVLSGGSSPTETYSHLANADLDWSRVHVTLTDERIVDVADDRSNEKMVRNSLMTGSAGAAHFERLEDSGAFAWFDACCALVGMGEDGHFASLFPDLGKLETLLDTSEPPRVYRVSTAASDVERYTLNLSGLLRAERLLLLVFGDAKRNILEDPTGYPVEALLKQDQVPVEIFWAP